MKGCRCHLMDNSCQIHNKEIKELSLEKLILNNYGHTIIVKMLNDDSNRIDVCIAGQHTYLDHDQARSLMLWLQEHLK